MTKNTEGKVTKTRKTAKKRAVKEVVAPAIVPESPAVPAKACECKSVPVEKPVPVVLKKEATAIGVTTIVAKVDIGFGNTLYVRGTGPGLSWEKGVEMKNTGSDEWTWSTNKATEDFLAKVLINDVIWSGDPDTSVAAGTKTVILATF